jgi:fatty acid-binding protein DegV
MATEKEESTMGRIFNQEELMKRLTQILQEKAQKIVIKGQSMEIYLKQNPEEGDESATKKKKTKPEVKKIKTGAPNPKNGCFRCGKSSHIIKNCR